jgi:hypothetical protein
VADLVETQSSDTMHGGSTTRLGPDVGGQSAFMLALTSGRLFTVSLMVTAGFFVFVFVATVAILVGAHVTERRRARSEVHVPSIGGESLESSLGVDSR